MPFGLAGTVAQQQRTRNYFMSKQKIRIRLKAFDYKLIDQSASEIVDTAKRIVRRCI